ncbi:RluA family pseudouridine synthase [Fructilactobacillus fructivorans]|uniref:Pseudouridine synthase n=1 Tax=Fructilactobacillus fructivorans TaxID=1614 RepID=A0A0C1PM07_9LACO|nr:RluA family pseudouridine synthase [Fructilactobacillus fructivorans]KID41777.1 Ribosomal large subunit pseudouridine synthase D [Fructilactobacillus fructivorans]MCT0151910.1 RluA family pseudouridine synthase [Fructilactobacillus fructivorans]MCT2868147.1 RluA family pseudouridine synthase [Fructilactobacillus fructivorans]MCT2869419.1 RluA family pseudouridine synthase [Fructilactobacillus fructivorans]MCT2874119.1 RluA family pseudouridine synthase [Fructilactobacillus fructivorans]
MQNREFEVTRKNERLDKLVADHYEDLSRSRANELIKEHLILVNEKKEKPKYKSKIGDLIQIAIPEPKPLDLTPQDIPLDIVYEDDQVIVVNKPQGMVVHPAPGHPDHTLVNALLYHTKLSSINGTVRPGIVHRIDKDTSGLLMVAKTDVAHKSLSKQLKEKTNRRKYLALVHGNIKESRGTIDAPIGRSTKDRKKQAVIAGGRPAITHFHVLERFGGKYTLVECQLETGRTHQIRVHMKYIGHPLVGDPLYGPKKTIKGNGQFLHAAELGFKHPTTGEELDFKVPAPSIFLKTIEQLRKEYPDVE